MRRPRKVTFDGVTRLIVTPAKKKSERSIINTATRSDPDKQSIATPWEFIHALEERFGAPVDFDLAADRSNAKAQWFFDSALNALDQNWGANLGLLLGKEAPAQLAFLNPPFAFILPWSRKLAACRWLRRWTVMLVPASYSSDWFIELKGHCQVDAIPRIRFEGADGIYPKDLALFVAGFGVTGGGSYWDWRVDYWRRCQRLGRSCTIGGEPWPKPNSRLPLSFDSLPDYGRTTLVGTTR